MDNPGCASETKAPACDIVILTLNQMHVLRPCVESVLRWTVTPSTFIVVNNGGGETVRNYCQSISRLGKVPVKYLEFPENIGFVRGNNVAVREGSSPYVCLLNNDCIVTEGWLERMIALAEAHPEFAVINPQSSSFAVHAGVKNFSISDRAKFYRRFRGEYHILGSAVGFCMLIKRSVIDQIGLFDEEIDTAYFEDTDFSYRVKEAGFECVQAADSYVHHAPFGKSGSISRKRREELIKKNRAWFFKKWRRPLRLAIAYDLKRNDSDTFSELLEQIRQLGRRDNQIHLFVNIDQTAAKTGDDLLGRFGTSHSEIPNLKIILHNGKNFPWAVALRMAFKWKKRYDAVVGCDLRMLRIASFFKWLCGFRIIYLEILDTSSPCNNNNFGFVDTAYLKDGNSEFWPRGQNCPFRSLERFVDLRREWK